MHRVILLEGGFDKLKAHTMKSKTTTKNFS